MSVTEIIFAIALLWVAYTYVGYPLLLWLRAGAWRRLHRVDPDYRASVSIVIAARNEEDAIARRIKELSRLIRSSQLDGEIVLVSDGSTDHTASAASGAAEDVPVRVIVLKENLGKAAAISIGCRSASNQIVILADARQTWAEDALVRLLENFADPNVGGASGELILEEAPGIQAGVGLYWKYEKWIRRTEALIGSTVGVSGSICAVRRELFTPIPAGTILDDVYWPMQVVMSGHRIVHDPRAHAFDRLPPKSRDEFRRKVRTLSGNFQLIARTPSLLLPWRNPIWFQFVSHKLMRLGVPWALLAMLGCCIIRGGIVGYALLAAQLVFYTVGIIATLGGQRVRFFLASPIASFLLLNAAAWTAFWVWISGRAGRSWNRTIYSSPAAS
jgi:cellulose synthase/poly-beta-1,6-N-acetylglucosamine synthase-like glycosyltransferase